MRLSGGNRSGRTLTAAALLALVVPAGCGGEEPEPRERKLPERIVETGPAAGPASRSSSDTVVEVEPDTPIVGAEERVGERAAMVRTQIARRGVRDKRVLQAMLDVPRHRFVPAARRRAAYADHPLSIGKGQTISQPYIVALMTEAAHIEPGQKVLEIGTGSGYGAAVASRIAGDVYTIEIVTELARSAKKRLADLGFRDVHVRAGDGYQGWPKQAPFDAIIVTAAPDHVPQPLKDQLAVGGRLVIPVGPERGIQQLRVLTRTGEGIREKTLIPVRFVPMTGEARRR